MARTKRCSLIVNTFVEPRDNVLFVEPTYAMYRFYSELAGARIVAPRYDARDVFPVERSARSAASRAAGLLSA